MQDVIFSIRYFAKGLFRNIPFRYVLLDKINAGVKFGNKKFPVWYTCLYRLISSSGCDICTEKNTSANLRDVGGTDVKCACAYTEDFVCQ